MGRKKLLFVIDKMNSGGAQKSLINLFHAWPRELADVDLLLFRRDGLFLSQVPSWIHILETPLALYYGYGKPSLKALKGAASLRSMLARVFWTPLLYWFCHRKQNRARQLRWKLSYHRLMPALSGQYDAAVAYLHGEPAYYVLEKVNAKRKVAWLHSDYRASGFAAKDDLTCYSRFDAVVTITDKCREIFDACFPSLAGTCRVIPNLISSETVRQMAGDCAPAEFRPDVPALVSVGRLAKVKGFDMALEAAALLKKAQVPFHWYFIGQGQQEEALLALRRQLGLEDVTSFLGPRENPYPYLKYSAAVVQTSLFEGKSIVLDEAKILCKPILATQYDTVGDQLGPQEGLVVSRTPEAIAEGLQKLLTDQALCQAYSQYLSTQEYGNQELVSAYVQVILGEAQQ